MGNSTETNKQSASYAMLIGSMLIFGTIGIFRRYIPLPSPMLAFARGILGGVFLLGFMKYKRVGLDRVPGKTLGLTILCGCMIGLNWMLLFEAYNYTTVAIATLCYYMQPVILILFSPLVLKERITARKAVCAAAAVAGMVLVSGVLEGGSESGNIKGILFGLGAAVLYAAVVMTNKKIEFDDTYSRTMIQLFSAAGIMIPYLLVQGQLTTFQLEPLPIVMLLIVGIVHTGIAYAMYFGSMQGLKASSIAILSYIDPVTALILSALLLHEPLTGLGLVGAVLIIGAAVAGDLERK